MAQPLPAVDAVDNDNKVSGIGSGVHVDPSETGNGVYANSADTRYNHPVVTDPLTVGNGVPGIQTGGHDADGRADSRGMMEKAADFVTGDNIDDKRGVATNYDNKLTGINRLPGEAEPSLKTGGHALDGTPDTRGVGEKLVDAITGDPIDDKTGKRVA